MANFNEDQMEIFGERLGSESGPRDPREEGYDDSLAGGTDSQHTSQQSAPLSNPEGPSDDDFGEQIIDGPDYRPDRQGET